MNFTKAALFGGRKRLKKAAMIMAGTLTLAACTSLVPSDLIDSSALNNSALNTTSNLKKYDNPIGPEKPGMHQAMMRMSGGQYSDALVKQANQQFKRQQMRHKLVQKSLQTRGVTAATQFAVPQWQLRGPTNFKGRVTAVVANPANPNTVYVGAALGGVWKSTNGGADFSQIFDGAGSPSIGALALDPNDANTIYVGTGESNPGGGSVTHLGDGLWRSTDAGQTWQHLGLDNSLRIGSVVVNPNNSNEIFVAAVGSLFTASTQTRGVFRSLDGGQTWNQVLTGANGFTGAIDVQMDPQNSNRLYAVLWEHFRAPDNRDYSGTGSGVWRSEDGGNNWSQLSNGLPAKGYKYGRIGIAVAPSDPSRVYAAYSGEDGGFSGFYRSDNYGSSWTKTNGSYNCSTFCWWFGELTVNPTDKNNVFGHAISLNSSPNGGNSFSTYSKGFHADQHAMWFSPNGNTIYEGNDGGIYRSTNGGGSYTHLPLPISQFYAIEVDPSNHNKLLGGLQDNGSGYTTNGSTWNNLNGGDGFTVLVDNTRTDCIYSESQNGNIYTTCGGRVNISGRKPWHTQMMFDESDNRPVYYGSQYLFRTTRNGSSISSPVKVSNTDFSNGPYNGSFSSSYGTISSIHIPKSGNGNTIYLGTDDGNVWVSRNRGEGWAQIDSSLPNRWVTRVTGDPKNDAIAYVSFSGFRNGESAANLYRTDNYGQSWTNISNGLPNSPVSDILIDPTYSATLYASNDYAVYVSYNTGASWQILGSGLPVTLASDLKIVEEGSELILHAGTYGRAIYSVRLNDVQRGGDGTTTPTEPVLENGVTQNVPNLSSKASTYFKFEVPEGMKDVKVTTSGSNGDLDLYVRKGVKPTLDVFDCSSTSGTSNENCRPGNSAGLYYVQAYAWSPFTNATITLSYSEDTGDTGGMVNHQWTDVPASGSKANIEYFVDVPAGTNSLVFKTQGNSGDADLYVKFGSKATTSIFDCKSTSATSSETCTMSNIQSGRYHVTVHAWNAISGTQVKVDVD